MTLDDAAKVAKIILMADGNCNHCITELADALTKQFPDIPWRKLCEEAGFFKYCTKWSTP